MEFIIRVHDEAGTSELGHAEVQSFAQQHGLESACPGRYSHLLTAQLLLAERRHGMDPACVVGEIRALEGLGPPTFTKPATAFNDSGELGGLMHKHYVANQVAMVATNMSLQMSTKRMLKVAAEVFDPSKSPTATDEMLDEFTRRVTVDAWEERAKAGKLTGEWIIYARHQGANVYLSLGFHNHDVSVASRPSGAPAAC